MRASAEKLYSVSDAASVRTQGRTQGRSRIALTSPLFAYAGAALGSVAVWVGLFKLVLG